MKLKSGTVIQMIVIKTAKMRVTATIRMIIITKNRNDEHFLKRREIN